jgi:hypothetical protein
VSPLTKGDSRGAKRQAGGRSRAMFVHSHFSSGNKDALQIHVV